MAAEALPIEPVFRATSAKRNDSSIMVSEEHRRPRLEPRVLAPSGTRTLVVALGTGHPATNPNRFGPATAIIVDETAYFVDPVKGSGGRRPKAASIHGNPAHSIWRLRSAQNIQGFCLSHRLHDFVRQELENIALQSIVNVRPL